MIMTARGKAFEYALARQISILTRSQLQRDDTAALAELSYRQSGDVAAMDRAASEAIMFLQAVDGRFDNTALVRIQPDQRGQAGDVRDVVAFLNDGREIGLSAKRNNQAAKHSRLSGTIDFGSSWADCPVSQRYWETVRPVFATMEQMRDQGILFRNVQDKVERFYLPVLAAFEDEFVRLCQGEPRFVRRVFQYLVGRNDFYKVLWQRDHVGVQSYNINGTLGWGGRWNIPAAIDQVRFKPGSRNTLLVNFAGGWQMSFRIHNARLMVEPSLKFDVQFVALPVAVATNQIPLGDQG